jgi:DNA-directed RNA polymerase I subunit RPA43
VGRINLQSEDHIGLLIYGTFNASIPKSCIPSTYEWKIAEDDEVEEDDDSEEERKRTNYGEWVNKATGVSCGSEDGTLEFNVVE